MDSHNSLLLLTNILLLLLSHSVLFLPYSINRPLFLKTTTSGNLTFCATDTYGVMTFCFQFWVLEIVHKIPVASFPGRFLTSSSYLFSFSFTRCFNSNSILAATCFGIVPFSFKENGTIGRTVSSVITNLTKCNPLPT